jgi:N-methylhydantoinase A
MPGPACYGRGGSHPTVTDADLVLGRIDPTSFAGGRMRLDPFAARAALARLGVSALSRMSAEDFAYAIAELVDEAMANAARVHAVENGKTLEERTLIAFGGAAPLHVARLAEKLGISEIIVPRGAGVGSAIGFLLAPISYELARSLYMKLGSFEPSRVNALLGAMAEDARKFVAEGAGGQPLYEDRLAFARYMGQGHEIPVVIPARRLEQRDAVLLRKSFEHAYLQQYNRLIEGVDIEILAWTVTVRTSVPQVKPIETPSRKSAPAPRRYAEVVDVSNGARVTAAVHLRSDLPPGICLSGPAIILEDATSTVVGPSYGVRIGSDWSIIITRRKAQ